MSSSLKEKYIEFYDDFVDQNEGREPSHDDWIDDFASRYDDWKLHCRDEYEQQLTNKESKYDNNK
jgi:hypothetical protein